MFWLDGKTEELKGHSIQNAFSLAGYGNDALKALDFYLDEDLVHLYHYNESVKKWENKPDYILWWESLTDEGRMQFPKPENNERISSYYNDPTNEMYTGYY